MINRMPTRTVLRLGHSPDPDDAFMWWPLLEAGGADSRRPRIDTGRFGFEAVAADIESLNRRAESGDDPLEITAISCAAYPFVRDRYALTSCGWSFGQRQGPKLIARHPMTLEELRANARAVIAVPGERTSAFAVASLMLGKGRFRHVVVPFEQIIDRVASGEFDAGLVIHEGQLTFQDAGLHLIDDAGAWWWRRHALPLPLGANAIRADLESLHGPGTLQEVTAVLQRSIRFAMARRSEGVDRAMAYARDLDVATADRFIRLYVNELSVEVGSTGMRAATRLLQEMHGAGLCPDPGPVALVEGRLTWTGEKV